MAVVSGLLDPVAVRGEVFLVAVMFVRPAIHLDLHPAMVVCNMSGLHLHRLTV